MTILLTGFEPFGDHAVNPSGRIAQELDGRRVNGRVVVGRVLPVDRAAAWPMLETLLADYEPHFVLATGVSGRDGISVETTARNLDDFAIADNTGCAVRGEPIVHGGAAELRTPIDAEEVAHRLWLAGYPAALSGDAGAFLCNHVYYRLLLAGQAALFIHLPRALDGGDALEHAQAIVEAMAWLSQ